MSENDFEIFKRRKKSILSLVHANAGNGAASLAVNQAGAESGSMRKNQAGKEKNSRHRLSRTLRPLGEPVSGS